MCYSSYGAESYARACSGAHSGGTPIPPILPSVTFVSGSRFTWIQSTCHATSDENSQATSEPFVANPVHSQHSTSSNKHVSSLWAKQSCFWQLVDPKIARMDQTS